VLVYIKHKRTLLSTRRFSHSTDTPHVPHSPSHSTIYGWTIRLQHAIPTCVWSYWYFDAPSILPMFTFKLTISFLGYLILSNLSRLTNDPIQHAPFWPPIPTKLPSNIPKFDGKLGEDINNHVMTFHLSCYSNSLMDDSIWLELFHRTLTRSAEKWYIELSQNSFVDFNSLAMAFLTHLQLPI
jgi:hypothetical protein